MNPEPISPATVAEQFFLGNVERAWYDDNFADSVLKSYTLWSLPMGRSEKAKRRVTFGEMRLYHNRAKLAKGHREDIEDYAQAARDGSKVFPPILVRISSGGTMTVEDGNRRCAAYARLRPEERKGVIIPAYILDYRKNPW